MLATKAALDYETRKSYAVTVRASDEHGKAVDLAVTVGVTNMDEPGAVSFDPETPEVGRALTARVTDPDGGVSDATYRWAKAASQAGPYADIAGATAAAYTPAAGDAGQWLQATASYTDGHGGGKSAAGVAYAPGGETPGSGGPGSDPTPPGGGGTPVTPAGGGKPVVSIERFNNSCDAKRYQNCADGDVGSHELLYVYLHVDRLLSSRISGALSFIDPNPRAMEANGCRAGDRAEDCPVRQSFELSDRSLSMATTYFVPWSGNRRITVRLDPGSGYTVGSPSKMDAQVVDRQLHPPIRIAFFSLTVSEGAGETEIPVTAKASPAIRLPFMLDVVVSENAGTVLDLSGGTLSRFGEAGEPKVSGYKVGSLACYERRTECVGSITVTPRDNDIHVGARPQSVVLHTIPNDFVLGQQGGGRLSIPDDEAAPTVTLVATPSAIAENGGMATITATQSGKSSVGTTVTVKAVGDATTGASDAEFSVSDGKTLTIAAGSTASTGTVTVTAVNDNEDEGDEKITVSGKARNSNGSMKVTGTTVTITDDDDGDGS